VDGDFIRFHAVKNSTLAIESTPVFLAPGTYLLNWQLLNAFSALFASQPVKINDHNDEATRNDSLPECVHIQQVCSVLDRGQDKGTEQRAMNGADRAEKACAGEFP
jgi:hypothetical protein